MNPRIKTIIMNTIKSFPVALIIVALSSCGSSGQTVEVKKTSGYQQSHGPFDSKGNYIESWADKSPRRKYVSQTSTSKKTTTSSYKPSTSTASTTPKKTYTPPKKTYTTPKKTYVTPKKTYAPTAKKSTPTKKSTARKITPKSKPPISHTVAKGDTLYGISRKYGASVSTIQKANGLSGNSISLGRRLIIPR